MVEFWEFKYRAVKFYRFTARELRDLAIVILVMTFIWAFNDGSDTFSMVHWTGNFVKTLIIVTLAVFIQITAHKLTGIFNGFKMDYRLWPTGLVIGLLFMFITKGHFPILLPGGPTIWHMTRLRIGEFRYGMNTFEGAQSYLFGPLANVILAGIAKFVFWQLFGIESAFLDDFFVFNLVFAFYTMLPISPLPGVYVFYGSKLLFVFSFTMILAYVILIAIFHVYSWAWAILLGAVLWFLYFWFVEKG